MKKVLGIAAISEIATGIFLLFMPSFIGQLFFGEELTGVSILMARMLGIALISIGVACWPGWPALCGMLAYNTLATLYLGYVVFCGEFIGKFLWPVVVLHMILTVLLARVWFRSLKSTPQEKD